VILREVKDKVSCVRTLTLIERHLKAGYINNKGILVRSTIGTPQGSIISPLLANIVLNKLDQFIENKKSILNVGTKRKANPQYISLENRRKYYKTRDPIIARQALIDMRKISKFDMMDNSFRRFIYIRYADDFVILLANTLDEA